MPLSKEQTKELISSYAEYIIDGMDLDTMYQMCHDLLCDVYENYSLDDIKSEILEHYDEEVLESFMENVKN